MKFNVTLKVKKQIIEAATEDEAISIAWSNAMDNTSEMVIGKAVLTGFKK